MQYGKEAKTFKSKYIMFSLVSRKPKADLAANGIVKTFHIFGFVDEELD